MNSFLSCVVIALLSCTILGAGQGEPVQPDKIFSWSRCLALALQYNPDLQVAETMVQDAEGQIQFRLANFVPHITSSAVSIPPTLVIYASQPVLTKARGPAYRAVVPAREIATANLKLALLELVYQLRNAYAGAYYSQQLIPVVEREYALLQDRRSRSAALFSVGNISKAYLSQLEVSSDQMKVRLEQLKDNSTLQRLNLLQITGLSANDTRLQGRLIEDFRNYVVQERDPQKLVEIALASRMDLQILRSTKALDGCLVEFAEANYYPTLAAFGSFYNQFPTPAFINPLIKLLNPRAVEQDVNHNDLKNANISVGLIMPSWRLIDAGLVKGQVVVAKATQTKEEILLQQLEAQIPRQVADALSAAEKSERLAKIIRETTIASDSLHAAQSTFESGLLSQLDLLSSQDQLATYNESLLFLEYTQDQALTALDRSVGKTLSIEDTLP